MMKKMWSLTLTLIEKDTILALFTDDKNADYYLLKAVSAPEILKRKIKDGWGVTHERGTKIVKYLLMRTDQFVCPLYEKFHSQRFSHGLPPFLLLLNKLIDTQLKLLKILE